MLFIIIKFLVYIYLRLESMGFLDGEKWGNRKKKIMGGGGLSFKMSVVVNIYNLFLDFSLCFLAVWFLFWWGHLSL